MATSVLLNFTIVAISPIFPGFLLLRTRMVSLTDNVMPFALVKLLFGCLVRNGAGFATRLSCSFTLLLSLPFISSIRFSTSCCCLMLNCWSLDIIWSMSCICF